MTKKLNIADIISPVARTVARGLSLRKRGKLALMLTISVYCSLALIFSFALYQKNPTPKAQASSNDVEIGAVLTTISAKEYKVGQSIDMNLTVQNLSNTQDAKLIRTIVISDNSSLALTSAIESTEEQYAVDNQSFTIPTLKKDSSKSIKLSLLVTNDIVSTISVKATLKPLASSLATYSTATNVSVSSPDTSDELYLLSTNKPIFNPSEAVVFTLKDSALEIRPATGHIVVSNTNGNTAISLPCRVDTGRAVCEHSISDLKAGDYTAWFSSDDGQYISNIIAFNINSATKSITPSPLANLVLPLGANTFDSAVPLLVKNVTENNSKNKELCGWELRANGSNDISAQYTTPVTSNNSCKIMLSTLSVPTSGTYNIKLANSNINTNVILNAASSIVLPLSNSTYVKGDDVTFTSTGVFETGSTTALYNGDVTIGILNNETYEYKEVSKYGLESFKYVNGTLALALPSRYFEEALSYTVMISTTETISSVATIRHSATLNINTGSSSTTGIGRTLVVNNYKRVIAGNPLVVTLSDIKDIAGNSVLAGPCVASLYMPSKSKVTVQGTIDQGSCAITFPSAVVTTSGKSVVSFDNEGQLGSMPHTTALDIYPSSSVVNGEVQFSSNPLIKAAKNTMFIGPVLDQFNNAVSQKGYTLSTTSTDTGAVLGSLTFEINNGYAAVEIPQDWTKENSINYGISNPQGVGILNGTVATQKAVRGQPVANYLTTIKDENNLTFTVDVTDPKTTECFVSISNAPALNVTLPVQPITQVCSAEIDINSIRNQNAVLVTTKIGDQSRSALVNISHKLAANNYNILRNTRFTGNTILPEIITTVITDASGHAVNGELRIDLNNNTNNLTIKDGIASMMLTSDKVTAADIKGSTLARTVDMYIDSKAGVRSRATNSQVVFPIYQYALSKGMTETSIVRSSSHLTSGRTHLFVLKTDSCKGDITNGDITEQLLTHFTDDNMCVVQFTVRDGDNTINLYKDGYTVFTTKVIGLATALPKVSWCITAPCVVRVRGDEGILSVATSTNETFKADSTGAVTVALSNKDNKDITLTAKFNSLGGAEYTFVRSLLSANVTK
jgi:hypothetical protein